MTIGGPTGAIATSSITITEVDSADYTVAFPTQTEEGTYNVAIGGPAVLDISGIGMAAAYQTSFTIDHTRAGGGLGEPHGHSERRRRFHPT